MLYWGWKFIPRFDANSYLRILDAWQNFDLLNEAKAESFQELFYRCQRQKYLVFSIDSDVCFYPESQQNMVNLLRGSDIPTTWVTVNSEKGHDAFLVEPDLFAPHLLYTLEWKSLVSKLRLYKVKSCLPSYLSPSSVLIQLNMLINLT